MKKKIWMLRNFGMSKYILKAHNERIRNISFFFRGNEPFKSYVTFDKLPNITKQNIFLTKFINDYIFWKLSARGFRQEDILVHPSFSEEYNTIMRLDALYVTHQSWLDSTGPIDIDSNFNLHFQKVLLNRWFEHPTLSC